MSTTEFDWNKASFLVSYSSAILVYMLTKPAKDKVWYIGYLKKAKNTRNAEDEMDEEMDNISFRETDSMLKQLFILHFSRKLIEIQFLSKYNPDYNHQSKIFTVLRLIYFAGFSYWNKKHLNASLKLKRKQAFIGSMLMIMSEMGHYFRYFMLNRLENVLLESNVDLNQLSPKAKQLLKHNGLYHIFETFGWSGWLLLNSYSYSSISWLLITIGLSLPKSIKSY